MKMKNLNDDEKKATEYVDKLRGAIQDNDKKWMKRLEADRQQIDWTNIRQSILDNVEELYEHENYSNT